jgi:hypothetical protein
LAVHGLDDDGGRWRSLLFREALVGHHTVELVDEDPFMPWPADSVIARLFACTQ